MDTMKYIAGAVAFVQSNKDHINMSLKALRFNTRKFIDNFISKV